METYSILHTMFLPFRIATYATLQNFQTFPWYCIDFHALIINVKAIFTLYFDNCIKWNSGSHFLYKKKYLLLPREQILSFNGSPPWEGRCAWIFSIEKDLPSAWTEEIYFLKTVVAKFYPIPFQIYITSPQNGRYCQDLEKKISLHNSGNPCTLDIGGLL